MLSELSSLSFGTCWSLYLEHLSPSPHLSIISFIPKHTSGFLPDVPSSEKALQAPLDGARHCAPTAPWASTLTAPVSLHRNGLWFLFFLSKSLDHAFCKDGGWTCLVCLCVLVMETKSARLTQSIHLWMSRVQSLNCCCLSAPPTWPLGWPGSLTHGWALTWFLCVSEAGSVQKAMPAGHCAERRQCAGSYVVYFCTSGWDPVV